MQIAEVVPFERTVTVDEAVAAVAQQSVQYQPFAPAVVEFCGALGLAISRDPEARRYAELQALAFFMRRSALGELEKQFAAIATPESVLVPRGVVFHIPPSNVDTIFLYSWLLSVIVGNRNIVRLSQRESPQVDLLCRLFRSTAAAYPQIQANTFMYRYGHIAEVTQAFSDVCDVRVIWGGDGTVETVRRTAPLAAHARELTFPDRYSIAAVKSSAVLELDQTALDALAEQFYNDLYWFDQAACSSPRLLVWTGDPNASDAASIRLIGALEAQVRAKRFQLPPGLSMEKLTFISRAAIDRDLSSVHRSDSRLIVGRLQSIEDFDRSHCGGGLLFEHRLDDILALAPYLRRRDQTLTAFGFDRVELNGFVEAAGARGVDRIVPFGRALSFHRFWDGMDLLQEFSRRVHVAFAQANCVSAQLA